MQNRSSSSPGDAHRAHGIRLSFCRRLTGGLPCGMPHAPRGVRLTEACRAPSRQSLAWPLGLSEFEVFHPRCCLPVIHPELFPQRSLMLVSLPL